MGEESTVHEGRLLRPKPPASPNRINIFDELGLRDDRAAFAVQGFLSFTVERERAAVVQSAYKVSPVLGSKKKKHKQSQRHGY
ncbi:hypothetical protein MHYP_G00157420 [Metynnis hypsauchen]